MLCIFGCTKEINQEGQTTWRLDPVRTEQVEQSVEGFAGLLATLTPFLPHAGAAAVPILAALGIWRKKIKPNYEKAKTEANLYHTTAHTIIAAIEELKKTDNQAWKKLEKELGPMSINLENVIRGMRNLPPKEANGG